MRNKMTSAISLVLMYFYLPVNSVMAAVEVDAVIAGRSVKIWTPDSTSSNPLVIWSHGFGGCNDSSSNQTSMLADEGYAVLAVNHADCNNSGGGPEEPWGAPQQWSDQTHSDRRDDWHAVLDELPNTPYAAYITDLNYIGAVGYSLGGYTVLGLSGGWDSWKRPEIKIVAGLSPYSTPYSHHNRVGFFSHDMIQYQGGTWDSSITPGVRDVIYPLTDPAKYYVEFKRAGHYAWANSRTKFDASINYYLKSLFNAGLKGMSVAPLEVKRSDVDKLYFQH